MEDNRDRAKDVNNLCLNSSAQDSIVALEALLEINNSNVVNLPVSHVRQETTSSSIALSTSNNNILDDKACKLSVEQQNNISKAPTQSLFLNNTLPLTSSSSINQPATTELNKLNNRLHSPNLIGQSSPIFPFICSSAHQIPHITLPNTLSTRQNVMECTTSSSTGILNSSKESSSSPINNETVLSSTAEQSSVRAEEIEAALRSKPQRGRRRDNLSVEERQELTRTRNRAHARSTRNRKKARYEELLEKEKKYDALMQIKNMLNKRRECVIEFMKLRSNDGSIDSLSTSYDKISLLIDEDIFEYITIPPMIISNVSNNTRKTGLEILKHHDECLIESLPKYGKKVTYEYKIRDESNGIAIISDLCYAMYDVIISNIDNSDDGKGPDDIVTTMLSGFINIKFKSNHTKIVSIKESLLNPNMLITSTSLTSATTATKMSVTANNTNSNEVRYLMIPINKQNNNSSNSAASSSQSFPNVISWNNICGDQQNASSATNTSSSATSENNANNNNNNECVLENNCSNPSSSKMIDEGDENKDEQINSLGVENNNKPH